VAVAKILIAEDSATAVELLKRALSPLGHTLIVASDGQDAEQIIRKEEPDLVILDIIMPKMNGFQLCRTLRSDPAHQKMPIIVITSMDRESDRYWGMKQGASEYLVKPVDPATLVQKVQNHLDKSVSNR
jgi:twitching motility two-component system response regulator PilH